MKLIALLITGILTACMPIHTPITHQYQINQFSHTKYKITPKLPSLYVAMPDAVAGYQTEQMVYQKTPYELNIFVHNTWFNAPATMLYPLILQSLQQSYAFTAVTGGANIDKTKYRLDTQVLTLQQNFMRKPSQLEWKINASITRVDDQRIIASRIFQGSITCTSDTPYGGAIAANQAILQFTHALTKFVIKQLVPNTTRQD